MKKIAPSTNIVSIYIHLFELQNKLIDLTLFMEKVPKQNQPVGLRLRLERVLELLKEDW